jgi:murein hydrolase activator
MSVQKIRPGLIAAVLLALWLAVEPAVAGADPTEVAARAARDLQAATLSLDKAKTSKDRVAALTDTVRAYENGLLAMRDGLRAAAIRQRVLELKLEDRRDQLSQLLGVLQTLERAPTPLLMIHPSGPVGTARSGMMLSAVTPALQQQADVLRAQLQEIRELKALQVSAERDLRQGLAGVQQARVALSTAITDRTDLPIRFLDDPVRVQILADNSRTLAGFADSLAKLPQEGLPAPKISFEQAKGTLPLPVSGTILRGFMEEDAAGLVRPGIVLSARALSLVVSPWPATIRYLGSFLDYGNVIILEPEAGYLLVLAGLGEVYGEFGQILEAGDPVGLLGGNLPRATEFLIEASKGGGALAQETLYIELRYAGEPTDPSKWFAFGDKQGR